jgi:hypothetical protein
VGIYLQQHVVELEELCVGLTESGAMFRYAEGKWTIKEVIGHLLDTERVFAYRLLRISRGDGDGATRVDERLVAALAFAAGDCESGNTAAYAGSAG